MVPATALGRIADYAGAGSRDFRKQDASRHGPQRVRSIPGEPSHVASLRTILADARVRANATRCGTPDRPRLAIAVRRGSATR
jgi:hypothetical protein